MRLGQNRGRRVLRLCAGGGCGCPGACWRQRRRGPPPRSSGGTRCRASSADRRAARGRLQRIADRLPDRSELQGPVHRDHDGGAVRGAHRAATRDRAGERGRDRHHDGGEGRHLSGASADARAGRGFDPKAYLPAVDGLLHRRGRQHAVVPFNASTPILYYNKDQFRLAGLDPETPPRTWPEVEAAAQKLLAAGVPCGFTTRVAVLGQHREPVGRCTTCRSPPGRTASAGSTPS